MNGRDPRPARISRPAACPNFVLRVWSYNDEGQNHFEGVFGPYTAQEAHQLEASLNARPRWDRHMAIAEKLTPWKDLT